MAPCANDVSMRRSGYLGVMRIRPFGVEQWMNEYETRCDWNLAETCVESLTVAELLDMAGLAGSIRDELLPAKLT